MNQVAQEITTMKADLTKQFDNLQKKLETNITTTIENKITSVIETASNVFENRIHTMMQQLIASNMPSNTTPAPVSGKSGTEKSHR